MNLRFIRLFIYSIGNLILDKIRKIYFTTKYYNNSLKITPPSRSYDMNNFPLILEIEDKNKKRINLINRFQKNIWKLDNLVAAAADVIRAKRVNRPAWTSQPMTQQTQHLRSPLSPSRSLQTPSL